ncbi:Ig-like domain-containing protein [Methanobrevibacter sp.]|uniref:Ig-like domain-containing protein n=1 Tax=Methanobrevibacter sp. TaxID=66852 RepID=UPI00388E2C5E
MKLKIFLIFLIAILAISAVHAEDNQTDEQIAHDTNITIPEKMWKENLSDIQVQLPENANGNLTVKINNQTIYDNFTQDKSVAIPITLPTEKYGFIAIPGWPPEATTYRINAFYNNIEINMTNTFKVMDHNQTYDYLFSPREILRNGDFQYLLLRFPSTSQGHVDIYIDNRYFKTLNATRFTFIEGLENLTLGTHDIRIEYSGDDYFLPSNKTYQFNVTDVIISLSDTLIIDHDDCLSVDVSKDAQCNVEIYVDGKLFKKGTTDRSGNYLYSLFDLSCTTHEIEVKVTGKYSRTLKKTVNVTYYIDIYDQSVTYGPYNTFMILLPDDMNPELLNITIGGVRYTDFEIENGGIDLDISKLKKGNYTVHVEYAGDGKYYPFNATSSLIVDYEIICPYYYSGFDTIIYLNLPKEANGNLTIMVNGKLYETVKLQKGYASISLDELPPGDYDFEVFYTGSDFEVKGENASIEIVLELMYEMDIEVGQTETITVLVSKNAKGYVLLDFNNKTYNVTVKNGKARIVLNNLEVGSYDLELLYVGSDGYNRTEYAYVYVDYADPKIKASNKVVYATEKAKYTFKVIGRNGKPLNSTYVNVKIANKKYRVKTNSNGVVSVNIPSLKVGKYNIQISYGGVKANKKLTVKHIVGLDTVKVKKSAKKLVLTAKLAKKLKGKTVTFKFNGKTLKAKTNANGIAKVTVKKSVLNSLKVGKKVSYSATCLKDTVKKSVKVGK